MGKQRIGLIYGGKSGEHEVSLSTAKAVIGEFDFDKYEIQPFYITKQGEWRRGEALSGPVETREQLAFGEPAAAARLSGNSPAAAGGSSQALAPLFGGEALDVVFPLLHGTFGEDGTIQGLLEMANVPYVGAGVLASAVGMDKVFMKRAFAAAGLPQCRYVHFTRYEWSKAPEKLAALVEEELGYPCFVKPANLGSSVGVSRAAERTELEAAVAEALQFDRKVIIEEFVDAREIEVAVLGNDEPAASVPGEIVSSNSFYDYKAKYLDGKSAMVIPAEISDELAEEMRALAIQAFRAVDGTGLSRVDFFLRRTDHAILLNEINTMPGFTPFSMYPLLWKETGKPYRTLLDELIGLALARHREKQLIQYGIEL